MSRSIRYRPYEELPTVLLVAPRAGVWVEYGRCEYTSFKKQRDYITEFERMIPPPALAPIRYDPRNEVMSGSVSTFDMTVKELPWGGEETVWGLLLADPADGVWLPGFQLLPNFLHEFRQVIDNEYTGVINGLEAHLVMATDEVTKLRKENKELKARVGPTTKGRTFRQGKRKLHLTQNQ